MNIEYHHVDVFSDRPFSGNGLCVFLDVDFERVDSALMLAITREMRQFESIFLSPLENGRTKARIFTEDEELCFAGHPLLGAAAVLHRRHGEKKKDAQWQVQLGPRFVPVETLFHNDQLSAEMNQGQAQLISTVPTEAISDLLRMLGLSSKDLHPSLPVQVISTGLPYLIVPVRSRLEYARICEPDFEHHLAKHGAKFVYVLDPDIPEGRTWDNDGRTEDVATGSAAGPVGAYLVLHGLRRMNENIQLKQGRFLGRLSVMDIRHDEQKNVYVNGVVTGIAQGTISCM